LRFFACQLVLSYAEGPALSCAEGFVLSRAEGFAPIPSIEHRPRFWHFSLFTGHWSLATYAYFDSVCCTVPTRQKFCPVSGSV